MAIFRPVRKLYDLPRISGHAQLASTTALGDWHVNHIVVDRQHLLILVSSTSLSTILMRARYVRVLADRLADLVESRLKRYGVDGYLIEARLHAMSPVTIAPTAERSVLGLVESIRK